MADLKFKDAKPIDTVTRIRGILCDLGIMTVDTWHESNVEGCYSVRVSIAGTNYGTNGKGATLEYALASGYAEFMERLQTDFIYLGQYSPDTSNKYGFLCSPDEKYISTEELAKTSDRWIDMFISKLIPEIRKDNLVFSFMKPDNGEFSINEKIDAINRWKFLPLGMAGDDFVALPFYDVNNDCLHYIPFSLLRSTYGSNGICAGNTPYEALVQGMSELFERHANARIIKEKIAPPTIPDDYLVKYDRLYSIIKAIESKGTYRVIVKDCSLGERLPVLAVALIDYKNHTYRVKFGAHPSFEIALERTLTELFQGISLNIAARSNNFFYGDAGINETVNIQNILKNSVGHYPVEFFSENFSYDFTPFEDISVKDNKTMLVDLLKKLSGRGLGLYIRDVSFLGFCSYHLVVPGFSEFYEYDLLTMKERCSKSSVEEIMKNLHGATNEELEILAIYIQYKFTSVYENNVLFLYRLPLKDKFFGGVESFRFLLVLTFIKLGKYDKAYNEITTVISKLHDSGTDKNLIIHLKCIRDFLGMFKNRKVSPEQEAVISMFYPEHIFEKVKMQFRNPEKIFDHYYKKTNCWNCPVCEYKPDCEYDIIDRVRLSIKKQHNETPADQMKIRELFSEINLWQGKKI